MCRWSRPTRRIAIVAQTGGIGFAIKHRAKALGIAISYCVSAGNEADLGAGEFLDYMVQDASTDVILLFIEGIRDVDKFLAAARRAAEIGKPVIVTKVGRSGAGERAAASHTASMAGWSAAYDAVFAKYGFIVSNDLDEAVTIAAVLTTSPLPKGDRVAVLTVSGGAGIWGADTVSMQGLQVPELSAAMQAEIRKLLPSYGAARNPIDVTAQGVHSGGLQKSIDLLERVRRGRRHPGGAVAVERDADAVQAGRAEAGDRAQNKPIVFYSYTLPSNFARTDARGLRRRRAVGTDPCRRRDAADGGACAKFKLAPPVDAAASPPRDLSAHLKSATLSEHDSKSLLRDSRHRAAGRSAGDGEERAGCRDRARRLSAGDEDPVARHPAQERSRRRARQHHQPRARRCRPMTRLLDSARQHRPDAAIQGVLVGPMAKKGVEIIVGTLLDATFGPMIMVGLGGITTELFRDVIYRPAPVSAAEAAAMLAS